jgi:hypothetical protein
VEKVEVGGVVVESPTPNPEGAFLSSGTEGSWREGDLIMMPEATSLPRISSRNSGWMVIETAENEVIPPGFTTMMFPALIAPKGRGRPINEPKVTGRPTAEPISLQILLRVAGSARKALRRRQSVSTKATRITPMVRMGLAIVRT